MITIIIITPTSSPRAMMSPSGRSGTPGEAVAASGAKSFSQSTWTNGTPSAIKAGQATEARSARGDPPPPRAVAAAVATISGNDQWLRLMMMRIMGIIMLMMLIIMMMKRIMMMMITDNHEKGENRLSCLTMMIIVMIMRMVRTTRLMVSLLPASIKSSVWLTSVASNWSCSSSYK